MFLSSSSRSCSGCRNCRSRDPANVTFLTGRCALKSSRSIGSSCFIGRLAPELFCTKLYKTDARIRPLQEKLQLPEIRRICNECGCFTLLRGGATAEQPKPCNGLSPPNQRLHELNNGVNSCTASRPCPPTATSAPSDRSGAGPTSRAQPLHAWCRHTSLPLSAGPGPWRPYFPFAC